MTQTTQNKPLSKIGRTALKALTYGFALLLLRPGRKEPLTRHGVKDATKDEAQIIDGFTKSPKANYGIATGAISGVIILDIDPRNGGEESLEILLSEVEQKLPDTVMVQTPSGGWHYYFRYREDVRSSNGRFPGIDVLSDGKYAVGPGSITASGKEYICEDSSVLGQVEIAEFPDWLRDALQGPQEKAPSKSQEEGPILEGQRNTTMTRMAGGMRRQGMTEKEIGAALQAVNARCAPPLPEKEVATIARSVCRYPSSPNGKHDSTDSPPEVLFRNASEIKPEKVNWLVEGLIPLGHPTLLEGEPGDGKSFTAQALMADLSRGRDFSGAVVRDPANSFLLGKEDHASTTVVPRMIAMGADLTRVHINDDKYFIFNKQGLANVERAIVQTEARLVIIDHILCYIPPGLSSNNANDVRSVMTPLMDLAEKYQCALIFIRHLSKAPANKAIHQGAGSIDFMAGVRSALMVGADPENKASRALIHHKCNLAPLAGAIGYSIENGIFRWTGKSHLTVSRILASDIVKSSLSEAQDFLKEFLSDGPKPATEVDAERARRNISKPTLRRAQESMGVNSTKKGYQGRWVLSLSDSTSESSPKPSKRPRGKAQRSPKTSSQRQSGERAK